VRAGARRRAVAMYNMTFRNYEDRLDRLRRDFTADGWTSLQASLGPFRAQFESFPLFQSAVAEQPPVITVSGRLRGRKIWKVEVPVRVTARFSGRETSRSMLVRMEIVKADPAIRPEALRIARYVSG